MDVFHWLVARHAPCPLPAEAAVKRGNLPELQWLSSQGCLLSGTLYILAANSHCSHTLKWLHSQGAPVPSLGASSKLHRWVAAPALLFLGDIGADLPVTDCKRLTNARRTLRTFQGLLRWCRRAVSDPSKGMHRASDSLSANASGQSLLVRLSMLPQELTDRVAVAAQLQHDLLT